MGKGGNGGKPTRKNVGEMNFPQVSEDISVGGGGNDWTEENTERRDSLSQDTVPAAPTPVENDHGETRDYIENGNVVVTTIKVLVVNVCCSCSDGV